MERGARVKSKQWDDISTNVRTNIKLSDKQQLLTEKQWLKKGYAPKTEEAGEMLWTNQFCQMSCRYLFEEEVKKIGE